MCSDDILVSRSEVLEFYSLESALPFEVIVNVLAPHIFEQWLVKTVNCEYLQHKRNTESLR